MEPIILYFVLFFPGIYASGISVETSPTGTIPFSAIRELGRTLTYTIPSLALLWYIILGRVSADKMPEKLKWILFPWLKKLQKRDLLPFTIGLPGLIAIGLAISQLVSVIVNFENTPPPLLVEAPGSVWGWIVMAFSCVGTGYLEESYFRYYLLTRLETRVPNPALRISLSTVLFSICHIYEGPWGILNAVLAGLLLSMLFIRYRSVHGIAWAHGAYNIFVYVMGIFNG